MGQMMVDPGISSWLHCAVLLDGATIPEDEVEHREPHRLADLRRSFGLCTVRQVSVVGGQTGFHGSNNVG